MLNPPEDVFSIRIHLLDPEDHNQKLLVDIRVDLYADGNRLSVASALNVLFF